MTTETKHGDEVREALRTPAYWHVKARLETLHKTQQFAGPWEACIVRKTRREAVVEMRRHVHATAGVLIEAISIEFCIAVNAETTPEGMTTVKFSRAHGAKMVMIA